MNKTSYNFMVSCALDLPRILCCVCVYVARDWSRLFRLFPFLTPQRNGRLAPLSISVLSPKLEIGETSPFHLCAQGELLRDANSIRTLFCFVWHISQLLLLLLLLLILLLDCELYFEMKYYHSHNIHFLVMSYINRWMWLSNSESI